MLGKRKIFGNKKKGLVREVVKESHNEELHALYCCHNVRMIKLIRTGCLEHIACMTVEKYTEKFVEKVHGDEST
jgi:hypothetical protein